METWAASSVHQGESLRREVFFSPSRGCDIYHSLYSSDLSWPVGMVICPAWGAISHRWPLLPNMLAAGIADLGGAGLVIHPPGHGDSQGRFEEVTVDWVAEVLAASVEELKSRTGAKEIVMTGIALGASAASSAWRGSDVDSLILIHPPASPRAHFERVTRTSQRTALSGGEAPEMIFGRTVPFATVDDPAADIALESALSGFTGKGLIVKNGRGTTSLVPRGFDELTPPGNSNPAMWGPCATITEASLSWLGRVSTG